MLDCASPTCDASPYLASVITSVFHRDQDNDGYAKLAGAGPLPVDERQLEGLPSGLPKECPVCGHVKLGLRVHQPSESEREWLVRQNSSFRSAYLAPRDDGKNHEAAVRQARCIAAPHQR